MRKIAIAASVLALTAFPAIPAQAAALPPREVLTSAGVMADFTNGCYSVYAPLATGISEVGKRTSANPYTEPWIQITDVCTLDSTGNPTILVQDAPTIDPLPTISNSLSSASWAKACPDYVRVTSTYDTATGTYTNVPTPMPYSFVIEWSGTGPLTTSSDRDGTIVRTTSGRTAVADVTITVNGHVLHTQSAPASISKSSIVWMP